MARRLRDVSPGVFHVYAHCVWASGVLFHDDVDRLTFLRELARATAKASWRCIGYCVMRSHYHLVLDVDEGKLPIGMHSLNFRYACAFNARYEGKGHVFSARYGSPRIRNDEHLLTTFKYVMRNPVKAGLCSAPEDCSWSSYAATLGLAEPIAFVDTGPVLRLIGGETLDEARGRLRRFVTEP